LYDVQFDNRILGGGSFVKRVLGAAEAIGQIKSVASYELRLSSVLWRSDIINSQVIKSLNGLDILLEQ